MTIKKTLRVTLLRSPIGCKAAHRQTVIGLGLKKIRQVRELEDTPCVRGMINKVSYLVSVED
jgi:large subunit ribosomal protein L30